MQGKQLEKCICAAAMTPIISSSRHTRRSRSRQYTKPITLKGQEDSSHHPPGLFIENPHGYAYGVPPLCDRKTKHYGVQNEKKFSN